MQNWNGIYDRTYFAGDAEARIGFHAGSHSIQQNQINERIRMGTMASNPKGLANRVLSFQIKQGYPKDSTGPRILPFLSGFDQSYKPFRTSVQSNPLTGGIKDFAYAQHILKQRYDDLKNQEAIQEGMPPTVPETLNLTEVESASLELDNLLTALDNSIEIGTISQIDVSDLKNIFRLIVKLSTTFDENRFAQLIEYMQDLVPGLEKQENDGVQAASLVLQFVMNMIGFLSEMITVANRQLPERKLAARALIDKYFKLFRLSQTERKRLQQEMTDEVSDIKGPDEVLSLADELANAYQLSGGPGAAPSKELREMYVRIARERGRRIANLPKSAKGYREAIKRMIAAPAPQAKPPAPPAPDASPQNVEGSGQTIRRLEDPVGSARPIRKYIKKRR